jgi:hypothetical protein
VIEQTKNFALKNPRKDIYGGIDIKQIEKSLRKIGNMDLKKRQQRKCYSRKVKTNQNSLERNKNKKLVLKILDQNDLSKNFFCLKSAKKVKKARGQKSVLVGKKENRWKQKSNFSTLKDFVGNTLKGYQRDSVSRTKLRSVKSGKKGSKVVVDVKFSHVSKGHNCVRELRANQ